MRKKLPIDEKRNKIIGIKVKEETRQQLQYIADREGHTLSTCIDIILITIYYITWIKITIITFIYIIRIYIRFI